jgi:Restriction endonuclease
VKTEWKTYEEVAAYILEQFASTFGLDRVEPKQKVKGRATDWEIDAKGVCEDGVGFLVIECRRYTTRGLSQEHLGSLAYRIKDMGAAGGIVVTPLDLQAGATSIAAAENIKHVTLNPESTTKEYVMQFLNQIFVGEAGMAMDQIDDELIRPKPEKEL